MIVDKHARDSATLTPLKVRWLGALLLAAQLPQAPHLPIWVAIVGPMLIGVRLLLLRRDPRRPEAPPARIPSWALALFAVARFATEAGELAQSLAKPEVAGE